MTTLYFESPFIRLRQRDLDFDEEQRFGRCDCTSYSYFVLSMVLFSVGTVITVLALGDADGYIFNHLGHMWLVGPIFICSGMMVAVKSILYLRRKSVIQMLLRRRAIFRDIAAAAAQAEQALSNNQTQRTASSTTLPPSYDALIIGGTSVAPQTSSAEMPPPTYEEAMFLIGDEKISVLVESKSSLESLSKQLSQPANMSCQSRDNTKP